MKTPCCQFFAVPNTTRMNRGCFFKLAAGISITHLCITFVIGVAHIANEDAEATLRVTTIEYANHILTYPLVIADYATERSLKRSSPWIIMTLLLVNSVAWGIAIAWAWGLIRRWNSKA